MKAHVSPLNCYGYVVTELATTANPDYNHQEPTQLSFKDLNIERFVEAPKTDDKKLLWRVFLRLNQNVGPEKNTPYNFAIALLGNFEVHPNFPADKAKQLVEVNGSSILYSAARQILRDAMNNGPFHPLILPTVSFVDMAAPPSANKVAEPKAGYGEEKK